MNKIFDSHSEDYSETIEQSLGIFGKKHDFYTKVKADRLIQIMSALGPIENLKVLDVGCGVGLVHTYLSGRIGNLQGADISGPSLQVARRANPGVGYSAYDGNHLPYATGTFDCAFAICVLHHVPVPAWQAFSLEMARVVRPGGLVVIIEHNPLNPATQWVVRHCELDEDAVLLWPWRLRELLVKAELASVETRYFLFTPFDGRIFRRLDKSLSRLPFGTQYFIHGMVASHAT
jgi:SAM-dependent methyltransferase